MQIVVEPMHRTLTVSAGANLLETLRRHEIPLSYSCMSGRCGTCRCKVISGEVLDGGEEMRRPLNPSPPYVLACQATLTGPCTIEVPEPDEVVVHPARILRATVVSVDVLTHDIRRLRLKPAKAFDYSPGQYAHLQFTPEHTRPYSMAGLCTDGHLEFHVRLVPEGRVTTYIDRTLKVGDALRVSGPLGTAYLRRKHTGPMLCVAGGTGLAPILSIVRGALEFGMRNPIHVYFGARTPRDVYGVEALAHLQREHTNLHVHVVVGSGELGRDQRAGLVTEAFASDWASLAGWRTYLCGAPPMVEAATLLVRSRGTDPAHIHADAFYSSAV